MEIVFNYNREKMDHSEKECHKHLGGMFERQC